MWKEVFCIKLKQGKGLKTERLRDLESNAFTTRQPHLQTTQRLKMSNGWP